MKTMKYFSVLFVMIAKSFFMVACGDADAAEVPTTSIVGEWYRETEQVNETYRFNSDGTGFYQVVELDGYGEETGREKVNFEYSLRDTDAGDHYVRIVEKTQTYEMHYDVTATKLLIYLNSGSYYEYKRK